MKNTKVNIRFACPSDTGMILGFIKEFAKYENLLKEVVATEELLEEWLFAKKTAEILIGEYDGVGVGYALFFNKYSTFLGVGGIYLEDLFVKEAFRGKGLGIAFLKKLANITVERGCARLEWSCLDWNTNSVDFYLSLGAEQMVGWTNYRLAGSHLTELADNHDSI